MALADRDHEAELEVTRHVAAALRDPATRTAIISALAESPRMEKQLSFQALAVRPAASRFLTAVARAAGSDPSTYLATHPVAGSLEVLLPIRQQRLTWDGSDEPLVAFAYSELEAPLAVNGAGETERIAADVPPHRPLVLLRKHRPMAGEPPASARLAIEGRVGDWRKIPRETGTVAHFVDCNDPYLIMLPPECTPQTGGSPFNWPSLDRGVYLYDLQFDTPDEPFWDPEPEYEIVTYGFNRNDLNDYTRRVVTCAAWTGAIFPGAQFAVTNSVGTYLGEVRLLDGQVMDSFLRNSRDSVLTIDVYEDDTGSPCEHQGRPGLLSRINATIAAIEAVNKAAGVKLTSSAGGNLTTCENCQQADIAVAGLVAKGKKIAAVATAAMKVVSAISAWVSEDDDLGIVTYDVPGAATDIPVSVNGDGRVRGTARLRIKNSPIGQP